jgi:hypothetical protein
MKTWTGFVISAGLAPSWSEADAAMLESASAVRTMDESAKALRGLWFCFMDVWCSYGIRAF